MFTQMGTSGNLPFYFFFSKKLFTLLLSLLCYYLLYTSSLYYFFFLTFPFFSFILFSLYFVFFFLILFFLCFFLPFFLFFFPLFSLKKTSLAGVEPAIFRFVVWRVSIAPQALPYFILPHSLCLVFFFFYLMYLFLFLLLVGSYQVGYTRSHPNTEVKMLRARSVPLCSHRWERRVIYLFDFFLLFSFSPFIPFPLYSFRVPILFFLCRLFFLFSLLSFFFLRLFSTLKRRAWQGSNLQSSDS